MYKLILLWSILVQTLLYAVDINDTIVAGDKLFYAQLNKQLDKNQTKDVLNLQQTLLVKLTELSQTHQESNMTVVMPTNQKGYQELFKHYLDESIDKSTYHNQLLENEENLQLMKNQIKSDTQTDLTKQLFYAYYHKNIDTLNREIAQKNKHLLLYQKRLISALPKIVFDKKKIQKLLHISNDAIKDIKEREKNTKLKIEQSKLMNQKETLKRLEIKMEYLLTI